MAKFFYGLNMDRIAKNSKIIIGMSGGVDSSVSALMLKQKGFNIEGVFMKNWEEDDGTKECTALEDYADAQKVADSIGIKLHLANFALEYWDNVFEIFLDEHKKGRTPNPDILCNRHIKFDAFIKYAEILGADYIATGHYAKIMQKKGDFVMQSATDKNKDQTYFLYAIKRQVLPKVIFPLADLTKPEIRKIAEDTNLATAKKKDSTGICFIGERQMNNFLPRYLDSQKGDMITTDGKKIGKHKGLIYYTLGQRQGLGIGGLANFDEKPWFVAEKNLEKNQLIVVQGAENPALYKSRLIADQLNWLIDLEKFDLSKGIKAKTRYRQDAQDCKIEVLDDCLNVEFTQSQFALTPGQSIVLYKGAICLGGGIIKRAYE